MSFGLSMVNEPEPGGTSVASVAPVIGSIRRTLLSFWSATISLSSLSDDKPLVPLPCRNNTGAVAGGTSLKVCSGLAPTSEKNSVPMLAIQVGPSRNWNLVTAPEVGGPNSVAAPQVGAP